MLKLRRGRIALQCVILVGDAKGQCAGHAVDLSVTDCLLVDITLRVLLTVAELVTERQPEDQQRNRASFPIIISSTRRLLGTES